MTANYDASSRYRLDSSGQLATRTDITNRNYILYTVRQGDTLETLAARYFGNIKRYWEIADLKPQIQFPLDIKLGDVIRIPV